MIRIPPCATRTVTPFPYPTLFRYVLAVAPALWHLGARRRNAGASCHEHRAVPRGGDRGERAAHVHSAEPQGWHAGGRSRPRDHLLSAVDAGPRDGGAAG